MEVSYNLGFNDILHGMKQAYINGDIRELMPYIYKKLKIELFFKLSGVYNLSIYHFIHESTQC